MSRPRRAQERRTRATRRRARNRAPTWPTSAGARRLDRAPSRVTLALTGNMDSKPFGEPCRDRVTSHGLGESEPRELVAKCVDRVGRMPARSERQNHSLSGVAPRAGRVRAAFLRRQRHLFAARGRPASPRRRAGFARGLRRARREVVGLRDERRDPIARRGRVPNRIHPASSREEAHRNGRLSNGIEPARRLGLGRGRRCERPKGPGFHLPGAHRTGDEVSAVATEWTVNGQRTPRPFYTRRPRSPTDPASSR